MEEPSDEMDQSGGDQEEQLTQTDGDLRKAAAKVAGAAAAAALLGALGGATKALLERRETDQAQSQEQPDEASDEGPAAQETAAVEAPDEVEGEPAQAAAEDDENDTGGDEEPAEAEETEEDTGEVSDEAPSQPVQGVSADEGGRIVAQAKQQLEEMLGAPVERVTGLDRVDGGWAVKLEVVEVARVPESTDVLAEYEVTVDEDQNLVSVNRNRRYRRTQIDEAS